MQRVSTQQPGFEAEIRRFAGSKPGAVMDLFSADFTAAGRITGWISGEFDFEVLHHGSRALWAHVEAADLCEREAAHTHFVAALRKA